MTTISTSTSSIRSRTDSFLNKLTRQTIMTEPEKKSIPAPKKLKLLTFEDYKQDIRARWLIFQREMNELIADIKKLVNFVTPIIKDSLNNLKILFKKK